MKRCFWIAGMLFVMMLCMTFMGCNQCSSGDTRYVDKIQYSLVAKGQTDGCVDITFPNGEFQANGDADLLFKICSDDSLLHIVYADMSLNNALSSKNLVNQEAAFKVANDLNRVKVSCTEGNYYIRLTGFAKEPITGIVFAIDKTYTNKQ